MVTSSSPNTFHFRWYSKWYIYMPFFSMSVMPIHSGPIYAKLTLTGYYNAKYLCFFASELSSTSTLLITIMVTPCMCLIFYPRIVLAKNPRLPKCKNLCLDYMNFSIDEWGILSLTKFFLFLAYISPQTNSFLAWLTLINLLYCCLRAVKN